MKAIENHNIQGLQALIKKSSAEFIAKSLGNDISLKGSSFYHKNVPIDNSLTRFIIKLHESNQPIEAFVKFFENLMKNPSKESRQEFYDFMTATRLPITSRGTFLAYRSCDSNWKDNHTRKMDNSIGKIVKMDRKLVDPDRRNVCSSGLHFAGVKYNLNWNCKSAPLLIVEINPRDVVSFPIDYNLQKGRCCQFKVLDVATNVQALENLDYFDAPLATRAIFTKRIRAIDPKRLVKDLDKLTVNELARLYMTIA